ncbi:MAG TPA: hypothetical protein PKA41_09960, partial [Verrucomicrobiota bacterium]|nr:hypothetical protein [Verrucomicrobiota bacterium]
MKNPRSKKTTVAKQPVSPAPARELSRGRLWLFRVMAISLPVLLLVLLEVALRIGGYGYETGFFKEAEIDGRPRVVSNERFTLRFFPPELARWPAHFSFEKHKPPGTIRIFVFGESAVMGDPQPSFGASRFLQVLLEERFPTGRFEIFNTGITAINSHVVRPIAR